jgi:hypothetical protein
MLLVIIILLVAFIVTPLIDLITAERIRNLIKIVVYAIVAIWETYNIFVVHRVV